MGHDAGDVLQSLTQCIHSLLQGQTPEELEVPLEQHSPEAEAIQAVNRLTACIGEIYQFIKPLSQGSLDGVMPSRSNLLASPFKELHAQLKHLTWQAERVAQGDYRQRVDFLGEFSTAFNSMVTKLEEREEGLKQINEELEERVAERTTLLQGTVKKLETANQELQHLAYAAAHDLRTPLRGVSMISDWLGRDYGDQLDERGHDLLSLLSARMGRMDRLIDGVLQYCQAGDLHPQPVDVNRLLENLFTQIECPEHIQVHHEGDFPELVGDPRRLADLFHFILENAIGYMDKAEGTITVRCKEEEQHWLFSVQDNGPGMDPAYAWKVFYIFYTLTPKDEHSGVGMGLALAKRIVEAHGGRIWVESTLGQGSTFFFVLLKTMKPIPVGSCADSESRA